MRATIACMKQLEYALNTYTQINVCCVHIYYGEKKCGFLIIFVIEKIKTCSADVSRKLVFKLKQASTYSGFQVVFRNKRYVVRKSRIKFSPSQPSIVRETKKIRMLI